MRSFVLAKLLFGLLSASVSPVLGQAAPCPLGFFSSNATSDCAMCTPGTFSNSLGATACSACPPGYFAPAPAMSSCLSCMPGTYSVSAALTGASNNSSSNSSHYGSQGSSACAFCPAGSFSKAAASACAPCEPGSYTAEDGLSSCRPCDSGTFQSSAGSSSCLECPLNHMAPSSGMANCSACANNSFTNSRTGFERCTSCPRGTFLTVVNVTTQKELGCLDCPTHATCGAGGSQTVIADPGFWLSGTEALPCRSDAVCPGENQCGINRIQPAADNPLCEACLPGYLARGEECIPCDQVQVSVLLAVVVFLLFFVVVCQVIAAFFIPDSGNQTKDENRAKIAGLLMMTMLFVQHLAMVTKSKSLSYLAPLRLFLFDHSGFSTCIIPTSAEVYAVSSFILIGVWFSTNILAAIGVHVQHLSFDFGIWSRVSSMTPVPEPHEGDEAELQTTEQNHGDRPSSIASIPSTPLEISAQRTKYALVIGLFLVHNPIAFNFFNATACDKLDLGIGTRQTSRLVPEIDCDSSSFHRILSAVSAIYDISLFGLPFLIIIGHKLRWSCFDWARILLRSRNIMFPLLEILAFNMFLSSLTQLWTTDDLFTSKCAFLIGVTVFRLLRFSGDGEGDFRASYLNKVVSAQLTFLTILLLMLLALGPDYSSSSQIVLIIAVYVPFVLMPILKDRSPSSDKRLPSSATPFRGSSTQSQSSERSASPFEQVAVESPLPARVLAQNTPSRSSPRHSPVAHPPSPTQVRITSAYASHSNSRSFSCGDDFEIEDHLSGAPSIRTGTAAQDA